MEFIGSILFALLFYCLIYLLIKRATKSYKDSTYYKATRNSIWDVLKDKGKYGEYLIYKELKYMELNRARFLFNVYIPKEDGTTTEIDVIMLCHQGIFVFESKNYSGWIFGDEKQKNWTQTLPNRQRAMKIHFYNPIMQNRTHIKYLKSQIGKFVPIWSIIAFSNRCTLKKIEINSPDVYVVNRCRISNIVKSVIEREQPVIGDNEIMNMYNILYPMTQATEEAKKQHIQNIKKKF